MTKHDTSILLELAAWQRDNGFDSDADVVEEYVRTDGEGWRNHQEFLGAVARDVWWHFSQAGDEEDRPLYREAVRRVDSARAKIGPGTMRKARPNPDDGKITIHWGAISVKRGWIPVIWVNGRASHRGRAQDEDTALERAKQAAENEADHYVGDWEVSIVPAPLDFVREEEFRQNPCGSNPPPETTSFEVRTRTRLEGEFRTREEAEAYAAELRDKLAVDAVVRERNWQATSHEIGRRLARPRVIRLTKAERGLKESKAEREAKESARRWGHRDNPEPSGHEHEVEAGMARALWVTSYADYVDELRAAGASKAEVEKMGFAVAGAGEDWANVAPPTPPDATAAAHKLLDAYVQRNNVREVTDILAAAARADGAELAEEYAESFGHYLAMMSLGHGVSWFDDHARFELAQVHAEAFFDGKHLYWEIDTRAWPSRRY